MPNRLETDRPGPVALAAVAGLAAGLVAALFLTIAAAPSVEEAIRLEAAGAEGRDGALVARHVQRGPGLFGAYAATGAGFGVLLGAAFVLLRAGRPDPFRRSLLAGAVLAASVTVSPWLKYPPNPPAVGDLATLGRRQLLYVAVIVVTAAVAAAALRLSRRLREAGWDDAGRITAVAAAVPVPLLVAYAMLPGAPDPGEVPAGLLWRFRLASLGGNLVLWVVLTLGFGVVASRRRAPAPVS